MHIPMQWAVIAHRHDRGSKMTTDEPTPQQIEAVAAYLSLLSSRGSLANTDLRGLDLRKQTLSGAKLAEAALTGANLTAANLRAATLTGADLRGANLSGADLRWANLALADLTGAVLTRAIYDAATRWPQDFTPPPR